MNWIYSYYDLTVRITIFDFYEILPMDVLDRNNTWGETLFFIYLDSDL